MPVQEYAGGNMNQRNGDAFTVAGEDEATPPTNHHRREPLGFKDKSRPPQCDETYAVERTSPVPSQIQARRPPKRSADDRSTHLRPPHPRWPRIHPSRPAKSQQEPPMPVTMTASRNFPLRSKISSSKLKWLWSTPTLQGNHQGTTKQRRKRPGSGARGARRTPATEGDTSRASATNKHQQTGKETNYY